MVPPRVSETDILQFADYIYQNFLWVLAAYEYTRTLDEMYRDREAIEPVRSKAITGVKHQMERVRMPLAKLEAAKTFPNDSRIAFPAWQPSRGIGWMVDNQTLILRIELPFRTQKSKTKNVPHCVGAPIGLVSTQ
jgi:hypothetical protein